MEDGFRLQDSKIAIIGLGLRGGSLALALKGKCAALYGIDSHPATLELARAKQLLEAGKKLAAKHRRERLHREEEAVARAMAQGVVVTIAPGRGPSPINGRSSTRLP